MLGIAHDFRPFASESAGGELAVWRFILFFAGAILTRFTFTSFETMKKLLMLAVVLAAAIVKSAAQTSLPVPAPRQLKWHEAEMGVVFHYDLHVFDGKAYSQGANRITPVDDYNMFNPERLDTDQWIRAARAAGAKFAVLTATHETGFGLWQSDVNPFRIQQTVMMVNHAF